MFDAQLFTMRQDGRRARSRMRPIQIVLPAAPMGSAPERSLLSVFGEIEAPAGDGLELIISWDGSIAELRRILETISDWGPFELTFMALLARAPDGNTRFLCKFAYHGADSARDHFEWNLKALIAEYAVFAEPRSDDGDAKPG
ncbi:MAG: hypothetical protein Tsb0010_13940 [Parvularculaceae bacterium]